MNVMKFCYFKEQADGQMVSVYYTGEKSGRRWQ